MLFLFSISRTEGGESGTARLNTELKQKYHHHLTQMFFVTWPPSSIFPPDGDCKMFGRRQVTDIQASFSEKHISAWFTLVLLEELFMGAWQRGNERTVKVKLTFSQHLHFASSWRFLYAAAWGNLRPCCYNSNNISIQRSPHWLLMQWKDISRNPNHFRYKTSVQINTD